jgi:LCP family protein required for cell wall assembly
VRRHGDAETLAQPPGDPAAAWSRGFARHRKPALIIALVAAAAALTGLLGREALGDASTLFGVAEHLGALPHWLLPVAIVAVGAVFVLIACSTAFSRHPAVKIVCLAVTVAALAAPGFALGYANGTLGQMGRQGNAERQSTVASTKAVLQRPLPDKPVNILLLGVDHAGSGDAGRSDSQILVRLDPQAGTISMFSLPRDLYTSIPGHGCDKLNAAYSYGGVKLAVRTFKSITGLPVNHFIRIDFSGFWQVIDILGGAYLPVDHRYHNPASSDWKSIDLLPGYQLVRAKQALDFVRFRHDQQGDFTRMVRQQLFLREVQRQAGRWSGDWPRVIAMVKAIARQSTTDIDSLEQLLPIVDLALSLDTSHVSQVHVEGSTPTIGGVSYVTATSDEIAQAVVRFLHPKTRAGGTSATKRACLVRVSDPQGSSLITAKAVARLQKEGYLALALPGGGEVRSTTLIRAPQSLAAAARSLATLLAPASVVLAGRTTSADGVIDVVLGTRLAVVDATEGSGAKRDSAGTRDTHHAWSAWRALDRKTPLKLEAPTMWAAGLDYDTAGVPFRAYSVETPDGRRVKATIAVGTVSGGLWGTTEYWGVQAIAWSDPPAIAHPNATRAVGGRTYLLFYQGDSLHMVAWRKSGCVYWVVNTLDDLLSEHLMLALAESCRPVGG